MTDNLLNSPIPEILIKATNNIEAYLSNYQGQNIVLFFYPKDNTPVCTSEAKEFRDHYERFEKLNTLVFGVSRDTLASHERFKLRLDLPFDLISDAQEELCRYFGVIKSKNFFGKKIRGIIRSTFLIDKDGILRHGWWKIKVPGHIDEVINAISVLPTKNG